MRFSPPKIRDIHSMCSAWYIRVWQRATRFSRGLSRRMYVRHEGDTKTVQWSKSTALLCPGKISRFRCSNSGMLPGPRVLNPCQERTEIETPRVPYADNIIQQHATLAPLDTGKTETPSSPKLTFRRHRSSNRGYCTVLACMLNGEKRAVKIPLANCSDPDGAVADLSNEIRILKRLRHPHLCSVYGAGGWRKEGELPFLVLERLQYKNLAQQVGLVGL